MSHATSPVHMLTVPKSAPRSISPYSSTPSLPKALHLRQNNEIHDPQPSTGLDAQVENAVKRSDERHRAVGAALSKIQTDISQFRDLLKKYQVSTERLKGITSDIERATDVWVPDISRDIDTSIVASRQALERVPELENRLYAQVQAYDKGQELAANYEVQLQWHAASWMAKLRKILMGEVKQKRTHLLRVAAPFVLTFVLLLSVVYLLQIALRYAQMYYRTFTWE